MSYVNCIRCQEFGVCLGLAEAFENDFHLLDGRQRIEHAAHDPDAVEVFLADKQFFLSRTGTLQIDRREETLVGQACGQGEFPSYRFP